MNLVKPRGLFFQFRLKKNTLGGHHFPILPLPVPQHPWFSLGSIRECQWVPWFLQQLPRGTPDGLTLEVGILSSWVPGMVTCHPQGLHRWCTEILTIFPRKRPICLFWSFGSKAGFWPGTLLLGARRGALGTEAGGCHLCTLPLLGSSSLILSRKALRHLSGALSFVTFTLGTPLDYLARGTFACILKGGMYLHILKPAS